MPIGHRTWLGYHRSVIRGLTARVRRRRQERGAVAVEVIILTPVFIGLFFGMVEVALLFRDAMAVTALSRSGARIASSEPRFGTTSLANNYGHGFSTVSSGPQRVGSFAQDAADAVQSAADTIPPDSIDFIRIYRDDGSGAPASTCPANSCVEYVWVDSLNEFRWSSGRWNPASINACLADPNGQSVGVFISAQHPWISGFFGGGSTTVTGNTIMKFEPLQPSHTVGDAPTATTAGVARGCKP